MSFYRTLLAAVAAIAIASPVFANGTTSAPAEDATATAPAENGSMQATSSEQNATEVKVNLNKATPKELMKVKGINASRARALVACRNKQADKAFKSVDDISKCKEKAITKIKADDLKAIQDQLTVE